MKKNKTNTKCVLDEEKNLILDSCGSTFFRFHDKRGKRRYVLSVVDNAQLSLCSNRNDNQLELRIFPYGFDIDHATFKDLSIVNAQFQKDKAGASREEEVSKMKDQL